MVSTADRQVGGRSIKPPPGAVGHPNPVTGGAEHRTGVRVDAEIEHRALDIVRVDQLHNASVDDLVRTPAGGWVDRWVDVSDNPAVVEYNNDVLCLLDKRS